MNQSFLQKISESFKRKIYDFEDYVFEKSHSIELSGIVPGKDLSAENINSLQHATAYHAVWCRNLRALFSEVEKTGYPYENFVDIGSGKGKACFYANSKNKFNKIIGVEFSKPLVEIANKNKVKIKAKNITFINIDATEFNLPDEKNLIFMFNPFDKTILNTFIANNLNHFKKNKSIIAYANDIERMCLTQFGFETIFRNQSRKISIYQLP